MIRDHNPGELDHFQQLKLSLGFILQKASSISIQIARQSENLGFFYGQTSTQFKDTYENTIWSSF